MESDETGPGDMQPGSTSRQRGTRRLEQPYPQRWASSMGILSQLWSLELWTQDLEGPDKMRLAGDAHG
jgi:hypothetical protein